MDGERAAVDLERPAILPDLLQDGPQSHQRAEMTGLPRQDLGAAQLIFDLTFTPKSTTIEGLFSYMERLLEAARANAPVLATR